MWRRCRPLLAVWRSEEAQPHRPCGAVVEEAGVNLLDGLKETNAAPVWKRRERVIRAAWAADVNWTVRMRARETELARAARIRANGAEQLRTSGRPSASSADIIISRYMVKAMYLEKSE
jgi:hypothetical protein